MKFEYILGVVFLIINIGILSNFDKKMKIQPESNIT